MRLVANRLQGMNARTHAEWAERMRELLEAAAWGSGAGETSVEFQMRRKWESALDELATLDFDGVQVEFAQALEALERIARQTMFAPESREAPVQVMGPLEAAGGTFDAVWFLRAGDLSWPMPTAAVPCCRGRCSESLGCREWTRLGTAEHARTDDGADGGERGDGGVQLCEGVGGGRQRPSPVLEGLGWKRRRRRSCWRRRARA